MKKIRDYIVGNIRYHIYYYQNGRFRFLIRSHIIEQFEMRLDLMDNTCFNMGECRICGCKTTALQFANRGCDEPCYPPMLDRADWEMLKAVTRGNLKNRNLVMNAYKFIEETNDVARETVKKKWNIIF